MNIRSFDKIVFCGMSGSGKTNLERSLLPLYKSLLVFDPDDEFQEYPDIRKLRKGRNVQICRYLPETDDPMELNEIAKLVWDKRNCLLVVSEAEVYLPVYKPLPTWIFKLINRGRRRNIGFIADTRRVAELHKTVFGLAEWVFIFRHFSPNDLKYLSGFIGDEAKNLADLPDYHFKIFHRGRVTIHDPVKKV